MLRTVAVAGYRSLRSLVLPLAPVTVVTGANGSGKSNLYRALRLLAGAAEGSLIGAIAREGGLDSVLWAGPEKHSRGMIEGTQPVQGTRRSEVVSLRLGYAADDFGYLVDLGLPLDSPARTLFDRDPAIKREQVFSGAISRPSTLLVDRAGGRVRVREEEWSALSRVLTPRQSILGELADGQTAPEVLRVRDTIRGWRFYDHFRTDAEAPARHPRAGTLTPVLDHEGAELAAALETVIELEGRERLDAVVERAFPGARVGIVAEDGLFRVELRQHGILRPLRAPEFSDGTLRYLLLAAALLTPRPPELMVLNEPETSLHGDLLEPLAALILEAAQASQLVVVTHSAPLIAALAEGGAQEHRLEKRLGETLLSGQGPLDAPRWEWGSR